MDDNQQHNHTDFRILMINDNPSTYQDFIQIFKSREREKDNDSDPLTEKILTAQSKNTVFLPRFCIDTATQGQEGIKKIKNGLKNQKPYALAFLDMDSDYNPMKTIKDIWNIDPDIQIIVCMEATLPSWEESIEKLSLSHNLLILKKPFDTIAVRQLVVTLTKKWDLMQAVKEHASLLEKHVAERTMSLQHSLSVTRLTLESSKDGILVIENDGNIVEYNKQFLKLWKIPEHIILLKKSNLLIKYMLEQVENPQKFLSKMKEIKENPEETYLDVVNLNNDKFFELYTQPQKIEEIIVGRIWSFRDITKRILFEKSLELRATHDALTGLPNRILLYDRIQHAISEAKRHNQMIGILFVDLDRFKLINDSLSHQVGDDLLKVVAKRLKNCLREEDTIARQGGDEFVIVVEGINHENEIAKVATKLLSVFKKPFKISNRNLVIGASIGISLYPKDGTTTNLLLRSADLAMYRSKNLGGNQFQLYSSELNKESMQKVEKEDELRIALEKNEFYLCYQPQYNTNQKNQKELIAVEALIRWKHPKYGVLLPLDFIPIAEETGLIIPIGEWVLREACKQNKSWQNQGFPHFRISVNVSIQQLKFSNFDLTIKNILKETKLKPQYLEIEITENSLIANPEMIHMINKISQLGVKIALDDFGTGCSLLSSLSKVHIDRLKIDRSFIKNINIDNSDEAVIQAIMDMSHTLNYEVLAEGVETQAQIDFLKKKNCEVIQGYYFGSPMETKSIEKLLKNPQKDI